MKWAASTRPDGAGGRSQNRPYGSAPWLGSVLSVWNSYFLDPAGCPVALADHLRRRSAKPNPVQLLFPFSFSCTDIFILLLKLLRAHYLRGRNVALIVWWLQCFGPFFSVCNQPARASCLMPVWSREGTVSTPQHGPWALLSLPQALRTDC